MCGVVGALGAGEEFEQKMHEANTALAHRGIRSSLQFCSAGGIGHVRLPIVGVDTSHDQPMEKGPWLVGFVGELLDFRDKNPGAECDAEVVLEEWFLAGPHAFTDHDGFWGIVAILQQKNERLCVLTDYLGQKPMYYRTDYPAAASEPNALLPFGDVTLDEVYLSACIKWGYCPDVERTPYNEIKHVLPGEFVVLEMGLHPRRRITDPLRLAGSIKDLRSEIELAVKRRVLSSDVPVAALVSGGLDSAIVYTLAQRYGNVIPYCAVTEDDEDDYWKALHVPGVIHLNRIRYDNVTVDEALAVMQEPIDLGSLRPQIALAKAIPEAVCLTGDGADEMFGGYERSMRYDSQWSDVFMELPAWHLPRLDRAMMINRVEVRSPFLARRVVELALGLPWAVRANKIVLRQLFTDVLPPDIYERPKKALRTDEIALRREDYSRQLVAKFRENFNAGR